MKRLILVSFLLTFVLMSCSHLVENDSKNKQIVFVHGANFDSSSWGSLNADEVFKGISTSSVDLPGRTRGEDFSKITLKSSARFLCDYLKQFSAKELVFIVHSQGGAVLHKSIELCRTSLKIDSIIYIAAVLPLNGETPFEKLSKSDESNYFTGIKYQKKASRMMIYDKNKTALSFANDGDITQRNTVAKLLIDEPSKIGDGKVNSKLTKMEGIKKYYIYTLRDRIISLESQKRITNKIEFDGVYEVDSGHLPMITSVKNLSEIISEILKK